MAVWRRRELSDELAPKRRYLHDVHGRLLRLCERPVRLQRHELALPEQLTSPSDEHQNQRNESKKRLP
jgi:hypothetical protein